MMTDTEKLQKALAALKDAQNSFNIIFGTECITEAFLTAIHAKKAIREVIWKIEQG